eukprot:5269942-Pleurochrysis_carterae.AAC.1
MKIQGEHRSNHPPQKRLVYVYDSPGHTCVPKMAFSQPFSQTATPCALRLARPATHRRAARARAVPRAVRSTRSGSIFI